MSAIENKKSRQKYALDESMFDNIDSEHKAYLLGVIAADGHVDDKRGRIKLAIKHADRSWLEAIDKTIFSDGVDHIKYYLLPVDKRTGKRYERSTLLVHNVHMMRQLLQLGITNNKSATLKYPDTIYKLPLSLQRHFIRGYFDGDGSVTLGLSPAVKFNVTKEFGDVLQSVIMSAVGAKMYFWQYKTSENAYQLSIFKRQDLLDFCAWIYQDSTIRLERKYQRYLGLLAAQNEKAPSSSLEASSELSVNQAY